MTDPVWSVNIMIAVGLAGTIWIIYKILNIADIELKNGSPHQH
jgi:hypothetical protein